MVKLASCRVFRCLMCLFLICCMLVNISPVRAHASAVIASSAAVVGISPAAAVAGILICLGVAFVNSSAFNSLVSDITGALSKTHFITFGSEELIEGLKYNGTVYVPQDLVEDVNALLYNSSSFSSSSAIFTVQYSLPTNYASLSKTGFRVISNLESISWGVTDFNYCYLASYESASGTVLHTIFSNSPVSFTAPVYPSTMYSIQISGPYAYFTSSPDKTTLSTYGYKLTSSSITVTWPLTSYSLADVDSIASSGAYDIYVAEAAPDLDDDEEYQAWKARRLFRVIEGGDGDEDPDDDDDDDGLRVLAPYYPVPGAENVENLPDSQDQAWAGNRQDDPDDDPVTDLEQSAEVSSDPNYDPSPDPSPDPDPEPDPNPDPDPEPAPDPQPDASLSGTALEPFTLPSLRNFFPFCIPFDLYDMLAAFVAEPEAPVFTFATGFLGQVFTVDIDLSPWNSVAKTVRAIQLCICIVGLAFATRKFIKW